MKPETAKKLGKMLKSIKFCDVASPDVIPRGMKQKKLKNVKFEDDFAGAVTFEEAELQFVTTGSYPLIFQAGEGGSCPQGSHSVTNKHGTKFCRKSRGSKANASVKETEKQHRKYPSKKWKTVEQIVNEEIKKHYVKKGNLYYYRYDDGSINRYGQLKNQLDFSHILWDYLEEAEKAILKGEKLPAELINEIKRDYLEAFPDVAKYLNLTSKPISEAGKPAKLKAKQPW